MVQSRHVGSALIAVCALVLTGAQFLPGRGESGPVLKATTAWLQGRASTDSDSAVATSRPKGQSTLTGRAVEALARAVGPLSSPAALADAVRSYFAFKTTHPDAVRNPYFYFVDYGLPSTTPRGYVFDMSSLKVLEGPFTVAHGRGSSSGRYGVPTRFSNSSGSAATSLGLYLTEDTYPFRGNSGGRMYRSIGLRLLGVSEGFNDNALARRVVAHGAPYVTPTKAGRSEGCPAIEQSRARELLPKLANGGMVFLYAPDSNWLTSDPWISGGAQ
jgi:L,D-transpeptidase catalytic domain